MPHTPGPYEVYHPGRLFVKSVRNFRAIAEVELCDVEEATAVATANLLAAAPEMLAALEQSLTELERYRCDVNEMEAPENVEALDNTILIVKAAIAKGKGEHHVR
jgi:hypothetical protein